MPRLFIHVLNARFESRDDGADYDNAEEAMAAGVRSALGIIGDEIDGGQPNAAVDVCIQQEDGTALLRSVVVLSVAPLMAEPRSPEP